MGSSVLRTTRRLLAPVVTVALLAGVTTGASAGALGEIRLQLGPQGSPSRFVYVKPDGTLTTVADAFSGSKGKEKCYFSWSAPNQKLVTLRGFAPDDQTTRQIGIGPDSLGVYDNASGVDCYRMQGDIGEGIEFGLDSELAGVINLQNGTTITQAGLWFDRLELDIEVKQDAALTLTVYSGTDTPRTYELRSGSAIVAGEGSSESPSTYPANTVFNCTADSDSGSDSGPNDNCRWVIEDIGKSFQLQAINGDASWEGGGDYGADNYANNSVISLTTLVDSGTLYCNPNDDPAYDNKTGVVGGGVVANCQITRINPNNLGQNICPAFPADGIEYDLETFVGAGSECELRKLPPDSPIVQIAGSMQVTFEAEGVLGTPYEEWGSEQTRMRFTKQDGSLSDPYPAPRCRGTVVDDANGNPTILEVLAAPTPIWVEDQVAGNGIIDWACVLDHRELFLGNGLMQVTQTVLFWGDVSFNRGSAN
jgi:hypothetical protein